MKPTDSPHITFLSSAVGRGHPFYLDGIYHALQTNHPEITAEYTTVFDLSTGLSLAGWNAVKWLYIHGSSNPLVTGLYQSVRRSTDYNEPSFLLKQLGRNLQKRFGGSTHPLVVDHPILIAALRGRKNLFYQHGELIVPLEALVQGAAAVFVPTDVAMNHFIYSGYSENQLFVSGLCIETALADQAESAYHARQKRYQQSERLTGAFFSSGAEPKEHVRAIRDAVVSIVKSGQKAIIFAQVGGQLVRMIPQHADITLLQFSNREELNRLTTAHFSSFDYLVAPSHERTNWGMGLGLPMFIVEPAIGTFSPLNRALLLETGAAVSLADAGGEHALGERVVAMREGGALAAMSSAGWGKQPITGFAAIARFLASAVRAI